MYVNAGVSHLMVAKSRNRDKGKAAENASEAHQQNKTDIKTGANGQKSMRGVAHTKVEGRGQCFAMKDLAVCRKGQKTILLRAFTDASTRSTTKIVPTCIDASASNSSACDSSISNSSASASSAGNASAEAC